VTLNTITIPAETESSATGVVVFLHGWGANAMDLAALAPLVDLPDYTLVFPNAPFPHPQVENGLMWYDLKGGNQGLPESRQLLTDWLSTLESQTSVPLSRTILAGFSQGAAMTLDIGLGFPLAGLIALSGYVHPLQSPLTNPPPPILMVHGRQDNVVPLTAAQVAQVELARVGAIIQYHEFDMGHEIIPEVVQLIEHFVLKLLPRNSP
jgi:phospholipase/carboxylesterase